MTTIDVGQLPESIDRGELHAMLTGLGFNIDTLMTLTVDHNQAVARVHVGSMHGIGITHLITIPVVGGDNGATAG